MKLHYRSAEISLPDQLLLVGTLGCIIHLGIGAHHGDPESMALDGINAHTEKIMTRPHADMTSRLRRQLGHG